MKAENKKRKNTRGGFTLVEIMLVVIIIGILAAVAVPNIARNMKTGRINAAKGEMRNIENALDLFMMDKGSYPNALDEAKDYLKNFDGKDPWGNAYSYQKSGEGFTLQCTGGGSGQSFSAGD